METIEKELDPFQSLQLIAEVISKTKEDIKEHNFLYLVWGWLIAAASFLFFILHTYTSLKLFFVPFPILTAIGIGITIFHYRSTQYTETYLAYYLKKLWLVLGISFIVVVFINLAQQHSPFTYTILMGGIGTLLSGIVLRFRPLIIGGILFFLISVASIFVADDFKPLLQGVAVIIGYLLPGYLLKYSKV
jgi:hypothetical protein